MKKKIWIISLVIIIGILGIIGILFLKNIHFSELDYDKTVSIFPEKRMLEFDETYYFNGIEKTKEDMVTGTVWRVDYNGHVSAFKFRSGDEYFDYADFYLSRADTKMLWEYADSLEGNSIPDGYEGYAYGSVLYKYDTEGEKTLKKFSGLSSDYPSGKEIFTFLSNRYAIELENQ